MAAHPGQRVCLQRTPSAARAMAMLPSAIPRRRRQASAGFSWPQVSGGRIMFGRRCSLTSRRKCRGHSSRRKYLCHGHGHGPSGWTGSSAERGPRLGRGGCGHVHPWGQGPGPRGWDPHASMGGPLLPSEGREQGLERARAPGDAWGRPPGQGRARRRLPGRASVAQGAQGEVAGSPCFDLSRYCSSVTQTRSGS